MNEIVIDIKNLSKKYKLGTISSGTFSRDLTSFWARLQGKDDPNSKLGVSNDLGISNGDDQVWALKDINLQIKRSEIIGVIGKNGAGKSTLLKILSRITSPTTGEVQIRGRVASLLEVGTGFHPELTGRENIYLNGAILGMRRIEIDSRLEEIIDFSGVEKYIETPVKRYSSGMRVRLAFSIAAHLIADILLIDEVLAVGDVDFQKKCLGKIGDISSKQNRTILFVSHNMAMIENLCSKSILFDKGKCLLYDSTNKVINNYFTHGIDKSSELISNIKERKGNRTLRFTMGHIKSNFVNHDNLIEPFSNVQIEIHYEVNSDITIRSFRIDIGINNYLGVRITWLSTVHMKEKIDINKGKITFFIDNLPLAPGSYSCTLYSEINNEIADHISNVINFTVVEKDYYKTGKMLPPNQGSTLMKYKCG